jgi:excisionase family DNA binding protein
MNASPDRLTFTADELADALHLAPSTVRLQCQRGEISATKHGRLWRIPRREYLRLVGEDAVGHEASGGDGVRRARERALRNAETLLEDALAAVRAALGE